VFNQEQFHALDRRILGVIFEVHNEFGRFLDELLFKREIAARCLEHGITPTEREAAIRVSHDGFTKDYFMDLLFCHGLMVEVKTVEKLCPAHRKQALDYLFLTGMQHGRLVNLRTDRVEHEFISTKLTAARRRVFSIVEDEWRGVNTESAWLKSKLLELLQDWGAFLEVSLYREAITWFLGGPSVVCRPVPVLSDTKSIGNQTVHLLTDDTAFAFTAVTTSRDTMRDHQLLFLCHTRLKCIQWVNFNRHRIEFTTLTKDK
jgi:iron complex transport system substrate-binding protein